MKDAVDRVYKLLSLKRDHPDLYASEIEFGSFFTAQWDEPSGR